MINDLPPSVRRVRQVAGVVLAAVMAITLTSALTRKGEPPAAAVAAAVPAPPADPLGTTLRTQAAALLRGDQAGWLRPVHPRLHERYKSIYRVLRAMRIRHLDYEADAGTPGRVTVSYCFAGDPCQTLTHGLTVRPATTGVQITAVAPSSQPAPWEAGDLVVREGRRVTVAAPRELAGRLPAVVRLADRAAAVDDRYAAMIGKPRQRYRLYLATPKKWRSWFGARPEEWVAGYMRASGDVVIDMAAVRDDADLRHVIQHELGHVATIAGARARETWLSEGLAEHIGRSSPDLAHLRRSPTIALTLPRAATADQARAFYAGSHFAVRCLVAMYGERAMMTFARRRLHAGETLTDAAEKAFGRPFATVDKACVTWISNRLVTSQE